MKYSSLAPAILLGACLLGPMVNDQAMANPPQEGACHKCCSCTPDEQQLADLQTTALRQAIAPCLKAYNSVLAEDFSLRSENRKQQYSLIWQKNHKGEITAQKLVKAQELTQKKPVDNKDGSLNSLKVVAGPYQGWYLSAAEPTYTLTVGYKSIEDVKKSLSPYFTAKALEALAPTLQDNLYEDRTAHKLYLVRGGRGYGAFSIAEEVSTLTPQQVKGNTIVVKGKLMKEDEDIVHLHFALENDAWKIDTVTWEKNSGQNLSAPMASCLRNQTKEWSVLKYRTKHPSEVFFNAKMSYPYFSDPKSPTANELNSFLAKELIEFQKGVKEDIRGAYEFEAARAADDNRNFTNSNEKTYSVRQYKGYVTIMASYLSYFGGAHGVYGQNTFVFSLKDGHRVTLEEFLSQLGTNKQAVSRKLIAINEDKIENDKECMLFKDNDGFFQKEFVTGDYWQPTEEGLLFTANPYDVAPYVVGQTEYLITWQELKSLDKGKL